MDTLIVLRDLNAIGTDKDGYELYVGAHGSGSRDESSSMLLDFAKSRRLRIAGSGSECRCHGNKRHFLVQH